MPRPKPPSKFLPLERVQRKLVQLDAAQVGELAQALGLSSLPAEAKGLVEEILSNHQTSRELQANQQNPTTPANVKVAIKKLLAALEPFLSAEAGMDYYTYMDLHDPCERVHEIASRRVIELNERPKIQSAVNEQTRIVALPLLGLVWGKYVSDTRRPDRGARRQFVSIALRIVGAPHPDPIKHPAQLDELIEAPVLR